MQITINIPKVIYEECIRRSKKNHIFFEKDIFYDMADIPVEIIAQGIPININNKEDSDGWNFKWENYSKGVQL